MPLSVLVVAPTDAVAVRTCVELRRLGIRITLVDSFTRARMELEANPDLVISEVRLREYNGLHLALRAAARGIPAIVVGDDDPMTKHDAERLGATYLTVETPEMSGALRAIGVTTRRARSARRSRAASRRRA